MSPRPKILKVIERNKLELVYLRDKDEKWKTPKELHDDDWFDRHNIWVGSKSVKNMKCVYNAHNIWSWFQKDEIRHIKVMDKGELLTEYMTELI